MKLLKSKLALGLALALGIGTASANFVAIGLDDLSNGVGYDVVVVDGGPGDINSAGDAVTFLGPVGQWNLNVTTAISGNGYMDLNSIDTSIGKNAALRISMWELFDVAQKCVNCSIGGTTTGNVQAFFSEIKDGQVVSSVASNLFGPGAFSQNGVHLPTVGSGPYMIELSVNLFHPNAGITSFDVNCETTPVPIPTAGILFGSALLGVIGIGRRREDMIEPAVA